MTHKIYHIQGFEIKARFNEQAVHFVTNCQLQGLMKAGLNYIEELCESVFQTHLELFGQHLQIRKRSLVTEIIGHIYAYRMLAFLRNFFPTPGLQQLFRRLSFNSCLVNCGNRERDRNRLVWDVLSFFKPLVFAFAKKK